MGNDQPAEDDQSAQNYKSVWNEVQAELKCCGIDSFKDWQNTTDANFNFPININKPEGCCVWGRDDELLTDNSSLATSSGTSVACVSSCSFTHIDNNHETSIDVPVHSINGYHTSCHLEHSLLRWDGSCSLNEVIVGHSSSS